MEEIQTCDWMGVGFSNLVVLILIVAFLCTIVTNPQFVPPSSQVHISFGSELQIKILIHICDEHLMCNHFVSASAVIQR